MAQAEARLKYLLSQSDIFSHFGTVKADTTGTSATGASTQVSTSSRGNSSANLSKSGSAGNLSRAGRRNRAASEELDEDEKAMAREEDGDEDGNGESDAPKGTILKKQPSCITGGTMRYVCWLVVGCCSVICVCASVVISFILNAHGIFSDQISIYLCYIQRLSVGGSELDDSSGGERHQRHPGRRDGSRYVPSYLSMFFIRCRYF